MCEVIIHGDSQYERFNDGWTPEDKRNALVHWKVLKSFEFIYTFIILQHSLIYLKEAAVKLQRENQDLVSGYSLIEECNTNLRALRGNVDEYSQRIFEHSSRVASQSGIAVHVAMPRISHRQGHRANPESDYAEQYSKHTVTIPLLDHFVQDLSSRFDAHGKQVASLQDLLPKKITTVSSAQDIKCAVTLYESDLPNPDVLDEEFHVWKNKWLLVPSDDWPKTLSDGMKHCRSQALPCKYLHITEAVCNLTIAIMFL
jgi:hypothetical protein